MALRGISLIEDQYRQHASEVKGDDSLIPASMLSQVLRVGVLIVFY